MECGKRRRCGRERIRKRILARLASALVLWTCVDFNSRIVGVVRLGKKRTTMLQCNGTSTFLLTEELEGGSPFLSVPASKIIGSHTMI